jgi:ribose transport system substrate-binding protein
MIMRKLKLLFLTGMISAFLFTAGCQDLADELVGEKAAGAKTIVITMVAKSSSNPVFLSAKSGAEAAARDLSDKYSMIDVEIEWRTPKVESATEQAERILNAVNDGTDAIIVSCSDDSILTSAINDAVSKGVPVMTFDSDAPESKRFAFYGPDDVAIGERVMTELAAIMGEKGKIAILAGSRSAPNLKKRVQGVKNAAARYPQIEIVGEFYHDENAEDAATVMMKAIEAHPELDGWAMVGGWPFFTDDLLDKMDPERLDIVAVDALPMQLPYIEKGIVDLFLGQPTFKWGDVCVRKVVDKIHLDKEVDEINQMKLIPVWKGNLGGWSRQLRAWGYTGIPEEYLTM